MRVQMPGHWNLTLGCLCKWKPLQFHQPDFSEVRHQPVLLMDKCPLLVDLLDGS